jgi:hypothetical protein
MKLNLNVGVFLALMAISAFAPAAPADPTLTVLVYDYTGLPAAGLRQVESETNLLLSRAGLRVEWSVCHTVWVPEMPEECLANATPLRFVVRIVDHHIGSSEKRGDPLGSAVIANHYATLYAGEIRSSAGRQGLAVASLMAYAAAHEIGHLLLGPQHGPAGIMQAVWGKAAYRDMAQRWLGFGAAERDTMQRRVRESVPWALVERQRYSEVIRSNPVGPPLSGR